MSQSKQLNPNLTSTIGMAVLGAVSAYHLYGRHLAVRPPPKVPFLSVWVILMQQAATFLTGVDISDPDIQSLITGFKGVAKYDTQADIQASFAAFEIWWINIKIKGLSSGTLLNQWMTTNSVHFDASNLNFVSNFQYNLYSDVFFMSVFEGPLALDAENYLPPSTDKNNGKPFATAKLLLSSIYFYYDKNLNPKYPLSPNVNPLDPNSPINEFTSSDSRWETYLNQCSEFCQALFLSNAGPNYTAFSLDLEMVNGVMQNSAIPDPFTCFRAFLYTTLTNLPNINATFWASSSWTTLNTDFAGVSYLLPILLQYQTIWNSSATPDEKYNQLSTLGNDLITSIQVNYPTLNSVAGSAIQSAVSMSNFSYSFGVHLPDNTGAPNGGDITSGFTYDPNSNTIVCENGFGAVYAASDLVAYLGNGNSKGTAWLPGPNDVNEAFWRQGDDPPQTPPPVDGNGNISWINLLNYLASPSGNPPAVSTWFWTYWGGKVGPYFFTVKPEGYQLAYDGRLQPNQCFRVTMTANNANLTNLIETLI